MRTPLPTYYLHTKHDFYDIDSVASVPNRGQRPRGREAVQRVFGAGDRTGLRQEGRMAEYWHLRLGLGEEKRG